MIDWSVFWCCLSDGERGILRSMSEWIILGEPFTTVVAYDLTWALAIGSVGTEWYTYWFEIWGLSFGTVEIVPDIPIDVVFWNQTDQASLLLWLFDSDSDCPKPCPMTSTFFALPA